MSEPTHLTLVPPVAVSDDMTTAAHLLGDAKTELWRLVRASEVEAAIEQGRKVERLCEDFRRRFFPRSREVIVTCDHAIGQPLEVFRRSSGRAVLVYSSEQP